MKKIWRRMLDSISSGVVVLFVIGSILFLLSGIKVLRFGGGAIFSLAILLAIYNFVKLCKRDKELKGMSIRHMIHEDTFYNQLGKQCTRVKSNKVRIVVVTFCHTLALVYTVGVMALFDIKLGDGSGTDIVILLLIALFLGLLPLRHWDEYLEFYEQGFCFCGFVYLYNEVGEPTFTNIHSNRAIGGLRMSVKGDSMDVSYLEDVKKKYSETYWNCA